MMHTVFAFLLGLAPTPAACEGDRYFFNSNAMWRCQQEEMRQDDLDRQVMDLRCRTLRWQYNGGSGSLSRQQYQDLRECTDKGF
jgi:hypothetical protein